MRPIKFRIWDSDQKLVLPVTILFYHNGELWAGFGDGGVGYCEAAVSDDTVVLMQFTGLHDKDGRDIYEGDILNCKTSRTVDGWTIVGSYGFHPESARVVSWSNGAFRIDHAQLAEELYWRKDYEVIGNVHKSPELIDD